MRKRSLVAVVLTATLAGCGGSSSVTDSGVDAFIAEVHSAVPQTRAYGRDTLRNIAENVCTLGDMGAVEVLDNYSQIPAQDRDAVARIALETACAQ